MSSINTLQELLQKNGKEQIKIEVKRFGGPDHMPQFGAYAKYEGKSYASRRSDYLTKTEAKKDCAQVIYDDLKLSIKPKDEIKVKSQPIESSKRITNLKSNNYYIWVDLDNSRNVWNAIVESKHPVKLLRGFGGPRLEVDSLPSLSGGLSRVETTRTNMKDSADYALFADVLLYVDAKVKSAEPFTSNDMILIISGDASLETACFILKDKYNNIDIRYIAKLSDLF